MERKGTEPRKGELFERIRTADYGDFLEWDKAPPPIRTHARVPEVLRPHDYKKEMSTGALDSTSKIPGERRGRTQR